MSWQITLLLFSSVFEVILLLAVRNRLRPVLAGPFCLGLLLNSLWALNYALDLASPTLEGKLWIYHIRSTFLPIYTVVWFETAFRFALGRPFLRGRLLVAALIIPAITMAMVWVPGGRALLYEHPWLDTSGPISLLRTTPGVWLPIYNFYNYSTGLAAIVILFRMRPRERSERISWMLFMSGALLGLIADLLSELNLPPTPGLNYAPIILPLSSAFMAISLLGEHLFDIIPVARATMVDRLKDVLLVFDRDDRLVDLNPAASSTLGIHSTRLLGRPADEVLAPWPEVHALLQNPPANGTREVAVDRATFEGSLFNIETTGAARPRARILALRDITLSKQTAEQLRLAKETAEAAEAAQSRFLAMMSHEIRTPMNGVVGFTQLLTESPLSPDQRECVDLIQRSGRSLLVIINDVLDYSKIAAGQLGIEHVPCNITEIAADTCRQFNARAEEKGLVLTCDISSRVPLQVVSDPVRIGQILINLVGNAIKFTEKGGVTVTISATNDRDGLHLVIQVQDTGIGITPEEQERIFLPFNQADVSTTRRFGGTGLGLTITRRLCELMNGSLNVESSPGQGSVFTATLLTGGITEPLPAGDGDVRLNSSARSLRVLVFEDDPTNQTLVRALLLRLGHQPRFVSNGESGLLVLAEESFDAVLMDIDMPVMDGYEAVRIIRLSEAPSGPNRYIIALTAHALQGERERCLEAGMNDFITKPITLPVLAEALARVPSR